MLCLGVRLEQLLFFCAGSFICENTHVKRVQTTATSRIQTALQWRWKVCEPSFCLLTFVSAFGWSLIFCGCICCDRGHGSNLAVSVPWPPETKTWVNIDFYFGETDLHNIGTGVSAVELWDWEVASSNPASGLEKCVDGKCVGTALAFLSNDCVGVSRKTDGLYIHLVVTRMFLGPVVNWVDRVTPHPDTSTSFCLFAAHSLYNWFQICNNWVRTFSRVYLSHVKQQQGNVEVRLVHNNRELSAAFRRGGGAWVEHEGGRTGPKMPSALKLLNHVVFPTWRLRLPVRNVIDLIFFPSVSPHGLTWTFCSVF